MEIHRDRLYLRSMLVEAMLNNIKQKYVCNSLERAHNSLPRREDGDLREIPRTGSSRFVSGQQTDPVTVAEATDSRFVLATFWTKEHL